MEELGKRIRELRLKRNLTQERLAELLGVTAQAVSKWENAASLPDISILPELSAVLGVTIDDLLSVDEERQLRRIEAMLDGWTGLSEEDFRYAERRLTEGAGREKTRGRCLTLLAELYLSRADMYNALAARISKQALQVEPEKKTNHSNLSQAMNGAFTDWCAVNHTELIDYYKGFIEKNPGYAPGYLWLMDNLIADGRLGEAREYLERMKKVRDSYHVELYAGFIAEKAGDIEEAQRLWDIMVEKYPDNWFAWSTRGDTYAKKAEYGRALGDYRRAAELQEPPRFTDNYDSIAQICAITGDRAGAIDAYERVLGILRDDWGMTEGEQVRKYRELIEGLK